MILRLASFIISGAALAVIISILARRWKELKLLNPASMKEEQARQKRDTLLSRRFERLKAEQVEPLRKLSRRFTRAVGKAYQNTYERLQAMEKLYRHAKSPFTTLAPSTRERIKTLLAEGRSLARDLKWADAERRFLEALSLDTRNHEAYKGLGQIYLKQRLLPQAKETFEFLIKLKKADDATYAALAEVAEAENDSATAEAMRLKAVEMTPRQAHRHAELAEFYLAKKQPAKAWPSAKRASELEPTSAKYLELSLETAVQIGNAAEAKQRFERLRLLAEDRSRFQSWRDKIEEMERKGRKG